MKKQSPEFIEPVELLDGFTQRRSTKTPSAAATARTYRVDALRFLRFLYDRGNGNPLTAEELRECVGPSDVNAYFKEYLPKMEWRRVPSSFGTGAELRTGTLLVAFYAVRDFLCDTLGSETAMELFSQTDAPGYMADLRRLPSPEMVSDFLAFLRKNGEDRLWLVCALAYYMGLSLSEIIGLKETDFLFRAEEGRSAATLCLHLPESPRRSKACLLPFPPFLVPVFEDYALSSSAAFLFPLHKKDPEEGHVGGRTLEIALKAAVEKARSCGILPSGVELTFRGLRTVFIAMTLATLPNEGHVALSRFTGVTQRYLSKIRASAQLAYFENPWFREDVPPQQTERDPES